MIPDEIAVVPDEIREKAVDIKPVAAKIGAPVQEQPLPPVKVLGAADADCPDCVEAKVPAPAARPDREAFATTVAFVRNPQEAARVAKKEDKLTFLLHLSGNFEEPGFT